MVRPNSKNLFNGGLMRCWKPSLNARKRSTVSYGRGEERNSEVLWHEQITLYSSVIQIETHTCEGRDNWDRGGGRWRWKRGEKGDYEEERCRGERGWRKNGRGQCEREEWEDRRQRRRNEGSCAIRGSLRNDELFQMSSSNKCCLKYFKSSLSVFPGISRSVSTEALNKPTRRVQRNLTSERRNYSNPT